MKSIAIILVIVCVLLCIPVIGMLIAPHEVHWTFFDFVVAGIILFITGMAISLVIHKFHGLKKRVVFIGLILFVLMLFWAELAVGIF